MVVCLHVGGFLVTDWFCLDECFTWSVLKKNMSGEEKKERAVKKKLNLKRKHKGRSFDLYGWNRCFTCHVIRSCSGNTVGLLLN